MASNGKMKKKSVSRNNETNAKKRNKIDPVIKNNLLLEMMWFMNSLGRFEKRKISHLTPTTMHKAAIAIKIQQYSPMTSKPKDLVIQILRKKIAI